MNACARLIMGKRKYDHITDSLQELHWLPVIVETRHRHIFQRKEGVRDYGANGSN